MLMPSFMPPKTEPIKLFLNESIHNLFLNTIKRQTGHWLNHSKRAFIWFWVPFGNHLLPKTHIRIHKYEPLH